MMLSSGQLAPRQLPIISLNSDGTPVLVFCALLPPLAWTCVLLRLWTRVRIAKASGWDDWLMLLAVVSC